MKLVKDLLNFNAISPTPITYPQTPYLEWISDFYIIDNTKNKIPKPDPEPDPPEPVQKMYVYVGSDGKAYLGTDGNVYASTKGE